MTEAEKLAAAIEALERIARDGVGYQNILDDYGHDANALNYHSMKYWHGQLYAIKDRARATLTKIRSE